MCGRVMTRAAAGRGMAATETGAATRTVGWSPCGAVGALLPARAEHLPAAERVGAGLRVLAPATAAALFIFAVVPWAAWIVFAFGWMLFPAVGLVASGVTDLAREAATTRRQWPRERWLAATIPSESSAAVHRIRLAALGLGRPEARQRALAVAGAAERLVAAATRSPDPTMVEAVTDRYLDPTLRVLERFGRLATEPAMATEPALREIEDRGLPALAAKLDRARGELEEIATTHSTVA